MEKYIVKHMGKMHGKTYVKITWEKTSEKYMVKQMWKNTL